MDVERRDFLKRSLRSQLEHSLDERVDRYLSINHQWITGNHYFAHASAECLQLYRDGYFLSCVMLSQALSEGLAKFLAERNALVRQEGKSNKEIVQQLQEKGIVSEAFLVAFLRIQRSFRIDYHHMNEPVGKHDHKSIAERNIADLAELEREIFECNTTPQGKLAPRQSRYWDIADDDTVPGYVRLQ